MKKLTAAQRAELEAYGAAVADRLEAEGPDPASAIDQMPPELALQHAALRRAIAIRQAEEETRAVVARARAAGLSWHKIAVRLGMTAEGARRKYAA